MGASGYDKQQAALDRLTALVAGRAADADQARPQPTPGDDDVDVAGTDDVDGSFPGLPPWWDGEHIEDDGDDLSTAAATTDDRTGPADTARSATGPARYRRPGWPERWRGARWAMGRRGLIVALIAAVLAAAWAGVGALRPPAVTAPVPAVATGSAGPVPDPLPMTDTEPPADGELGAGPGGESDGDPEEIVVAVQGLVAVSGLVRLPAGARVDDALAAAGGVLEGADLYSLNLAQHLADGDQVLVGLAATDDGPVRLGSATVPAGGGASPAATGPSEAGTAASGALDLNSATAAELETLPGIGPVTASAIIAWRTENGPFTAVDELTRVSGIGPARLSALREHVTVG